MRPRSCLRALRQRYDEVNQNRKKDMKDQFEHFAMKSGEQYKSISKRFLTLTNQLADMGVFYEDEKKRQIFRDSLKNAEWDDALKNEKINRMRHLIDHKVDKIPYSFEECQKFFQQDEDDRKYRDKH